MAKLSWGKPKVEFALLGADGTPGVWQTFPEIVRDTATLEVTEGDELRGEQEGGELVDSKRLASSYLFSLEVFAKKGDTKPIPDINGVVAGNYAVRLTPEDPQAIGFQMLNTSISAGKSWTAADGMHWIYAMTGLVPVSGGDICPEYSAGVAPVATPASVDIAQAGETQNVTFDKPIATFAPIAPAAWLTIAGSGTAWTLTAAANSTGADLSATLKATAADGGVTTVTVTQAGTPSA